MRVLKPSETHTMPPDDHIHTVLLCQMTHRNINFKFTYKIIILIQLCIHLPSVLLAQISHNHCTQIWQSAYQNKHNILFQ